MISEQRYTAWGEVRFESGATPTKYTYTGQYSYAGDFGLMYYNARWYDPSLGRFNQADTIIPGGMQGLDRYAYVNNLPTNYTDPSGHIARKELCMYMGICTKKDRERYGDIYDILLKANWGDKIEWKVNGKAQVAMLVLLGQGSNTNSQAKTFKGVLWGIEGDNVGYPIGVDALLGADRKEDGTTTVDITLSHPEVQSVENLPIHETLKKDRNLYVPGASYAQVGHYYDLPGPGIVLTTGLLIVETPVGVVVGLALMLDVAGYFNLPPDIQYEYDHMFGKVTEYPLVFIESHDMRGGFGVSAPPGANP